jgi:hypothetical protein
VFHDGRVIPPGPLQLTVISLGGLSLLASTVVMTGNAAVLLANARGAEPKLRQATLVGAAFALLGWWLLRQVLALPVWPLFVMAGLDAGLCLLNALWLRLDRR